MSETRTVYVAHTNTDCTEGRGRDVPIAVCRMESTARRIARGRYVQGSDGPVHPVNMVEINGRWFLPANCVDIIEPSAGDVAAQEKLDERGAAVAKAKAAGLTDDDIRALRA